MLELTNGNIDQILSENEIVVIDFWAEWCGPCKIFAPIFEQVSVEMPHIAFGKCNVDEAPELAMKYDVRVIPTIVVLKGGDTVFRQTGMMTKTKLAAIVNEHDLVKILE